jgi:hypothetical protein
VIGAGGRDLSSVDVLGELGLLCQAAGGEHPRPGGVGDGVASAASEDDRAADGDRGADQRPAEELQDLYIRQLLDGHEHAPEVVVAWQGGEPTIMGLDFFRRSIELQEKYARPGQRILNTLQTNGTLLDDDWGAFLKEHGFLVGISIDGPREIHDTYRVSKGGKPTFDRVIHGLDVLRAPRCRVERADLAARGER